MVLAEAVVVGCGVWRWWCAVGVTYVDVDGQGDVAADIAVMGLVMVKFAGCARGCGWVVVWALDWTGCVVCVCE